MTTRHLRTIRASAWYDLLVTAPFATPWTFALAHRAMNAAARALGVGELPPPEPVLTLFANLMGSLVVVWALLRLLRPLPVHGLYDGAARVLFACWQAWALAHGATGLLGGFLAVEVAFGVAQLWPWAAARRGAGCQWQAAE
ncbi:hypothetical protein [Kitasatospora cheerisanensis]|uniref:Uncharacterized protein n=1 Tax=Kitasatospora cheerisanensis KCTC 2395 TaxID=1348663 RepID=A0A066YYQ4_9ACTN|nr:hypothetical protein [Kitasatospora cheerisanensis]KDN85124.1 hypothetical protein KCH_32230 [Kitasatospora cheerisanensis KCTC 2395]